jgi:predicted ATP-dependent endonuclease of OLD family
MQLTSVKVGPFRSINEPQTTDIDPQTTVLVGMNEAGKTVFLKALHKAKDALGKEKFNLIDDYPRKDLNSYKRRHDGAPDTAVALTYTLTDHELKQLNTRIGYEIEGPFKFSVFHKYDDSRSTDFSIDEKPTLLKLAKSNDLSKELAEALGSAESIRGVLTSLKEANLTSDADKQFLETLEARAKKAGSNWASVVGYEAYTSFSALIPQFLYFSDYDLLPGKLNLTDLKNRLAQAVSDPANAHKQIEPKHQSVLALLRMADVDLDDFSANASYEDLKSQIEAVSISLTDQVLEFWKQNEDLEVEVDIRTDPSDAAPFNNGPNLYLRIKNRRHRGVSTPFDQRSRGFIWFFSFLVWFDSVQHQLNPGGSTTSTNLILLLDEPALALHALAQSDFLRYIDNLAESHQVIYTTHSPFMVHSDRLHQVRVVEDKLNIGTVISANLSGSDSKTIFPLQAALGWNIAQNLFIAKQNLVVEGVSELAILQAMSKAVEDEGNKGLQSGVSIVPAGGLSNVATFISLLGGSGLKFAILHDYSGKPDQKLDSMIQQKLLNQKSVFNFSQFRDMSNIGADTIATDLEDLIDVPTYLEYFNKVFAKQLNGVVVSEGDLPAGDRIVQRLEKYLSSKSLKLRPSGGFNHYSVASAIATIPPAKFSSETIERFKALFDAINQTLK